MKRDINDSPRHWRIHTDYQWGGADNRYSIQSPDGRMIAQSIRWKDATRILRALRSETHAPS